MNNMSTAALSVSDVNRYIKTLIRGDDLLSAIAVRGEISNFKCHGTGHLYFTLKDSDAEISVIMFRSDASRLGFNLDNGMRVIIYGFVDVYEKAGKYQLYAKAVSADGVGAMAIAFERLKRKLEGEGLFEESRKRPIPRFPKKIGVITAPTGAAIRDILNITGRRYPLAEILIYPSLVQGADAPASLRFGMEYLNAEGSCDVIIIGRGGGSVEDLWAFNDEALVRAVAASGIPVISAVGHETDFTLCDFAADLRAPTPSAAAEIAVPDRGELLRLIANTEQSLERGAQAALHRRQAQLERAENMLRAYSPSARLTAMRQKVAHTESALESLTLRIYERRQGEYRRLAESLGALNPLSILSRGYGAVRNGEGGLICSASALTAGDRITLLMADGEADATVENIRINKEKQEI